METIFIILTMLLLIGLFTSNEDNKSLEEFETDVPHGDKFHNKKEEQFYHPVTGYKGTKSEMDAYIINRERK